MFDRLTGYIPDSFSWQHENLPGLNVNSTGLEIRSTNLLERRGKAITTHFQDRRGAAWEALFLVWFSVGANKSYPVKCEPDSM